MNITGINNITYPENNFVMVGPDLFFEVPTTELDWTEQNVMSVPENRTSVFVPRGQTADNFSEKINYTISKLRCAPCIHSTIDMLVKAFSQNNGTGSILEQGDGYAIIEGVRQHTDGTYSYDLITIKWDQDTFAMLGYQNTHAAKPELLRETYLPMMQNSEICYV